MAESFLYFTAIKSYKEAWSTLHLEAIFSFLFPQNEFIFKRMFSDLGNLGRD